MHSETSYYWAYHVPGFSPGIQEFTADEPQVVQFNRQYGLQITGNSADTAYPIPPTPISITDASVTPSNLRWQGSAWASSYKVSRSSDEVSYNQISSSVSDAVVSGNSYFSDSNVSKGQRYWYSIVAVNPDGASSGQLVLGPYSV